MAKSTTKVTKKPVSKAKVHKDMADVANKPAGMHSNEDVQETMRAFNKLLIAFAAERGLKITRQGNATYSKLHKTLRLPNYKLSNPPAEMSKGTRVLLGEREGTVNKIAGKIAVVQFDDDHKPIRVQQSRLTVLETAPEAKRKNVLPVLGQGIRVVPGTEYAVKGGGSAILKSEREGRQLMWVIEVKAKGAKSFKRYGIYGSARKGLEGDVNRRFAEQQLRRITASVKGAKRTNPTAE